MGVGGSGSNQGTSTANNLGGAGGGVTGTAGLSTTSYAGQGGTQTKGGATGTDRGDQIGTFGIGGSLTKAQTGGGRRRRLVWPAALDLGKAGGGGSGFVFTEANYNAGYTSSSYTGGTWLLDNKYFLGEESYTIAGNMEMPTYDGIGTMAGNSGNGYAKITPLLNTPVYEVEMTLNGEAEISITKGSTYQESGATLIKDEIDISDRIQITGNVDINVEGEYILTYSYYDTDTKQAYTVTRKVIVEAPTTYDIEFEYSGEMKVWTVPYTGNYEIQVWGAARSSTCKPCVWKRRIF